MLGPPYARRPETRIGHIPIRVGKIPGAEKVRLPSSVDGREVDVVNFTRALVRFLARGHEILQGAIDIGTKSVHCELHAARYNSRANIDKDDRNSSVAPEIEIMPVQVVREFELDLDLPGPLLPLVPQFADPPL